MHRPLSTWILPALLALLLLQPRPAQAAMPIIQVYHEWVVELEFAKIRTRTCRFGLSETDRIGGEIGRKIVGRETIFHLGYFSPALPFPLHQIFVFFLICIMALILHQSQASRQSRNQ